MEIGNYVRANARTLKKFVGITKCESEDKNYWYFEDLTIYKKYAEDYNFKSSPNIIDLIEVGDYVNGEKVRSIAEPPGVENRYINMMDCYEKNIKSIVTKEQFESMEYKVGE